MLRKNEIPLLQEEKNKRPRESEPTTSTSSTNGISLLLQASEAIKQQKTHSKQKHRKSKIQKNNLKILQGSLKKRLR